MRTYVLAMVGAALFALPTSAFSQAVEQFAGSVARDLRSVPSRASEGDESLGKAGRTGLRLIFQHESNGLVSREVT